MQCLSPWLHWCSGHASSDTRPGEPGVATGGLGPSCPQAPAQMLTCLFILSSCSFPMHTALCPAIPSRLPISQPCFLQLECSPLYCGNPSQPAGVLSVPADPWASLRVALNYTALHCCFLLRLTGPARPAPSSRTFCSDGRCPVQ